VQTIDGHGLGECHWPPGSANAKVIVEGITAVGVRLVRTTMRSVRIA
jgi:hypothetical protein